MKCHLPGRLERSRSEGVFEDNFSYFSSKPYVVTLHLNRLTETVQMRGHNIWFYAELTKIILNYHQILSLIYSSGLIMLPPARTQTYYPYDLTSNKTCQRDRKARLTAPCPSYKKL